MHAPDRGRACKPSAKEKFSCHFCKKTAVVRHSARIASAEDLFPAKREQKKPRSRSFYREALPQQGNPTCKQTHFFCKQREKLCRLDEKASPPQRKEPLPPQRKTLLTLARELCPPGEANPFSPGEKPCPLSSEKNPSRSDGKAYSPWRESRLATTSTRRRATSRLLIRGSSTSSSAVTSHTSLSSAPKASPSPT